MGILKKILVLPVLFASVVLATSCGDSSYKIKNKSFVYESHTTENVGENFYRDTNLAGKNEEEVKNSIVKGLYYNGENDGSSLDFSSDIYLTDIKYEGVKITPLTVNKYKKSDYESSSLGAYYDINGDGLSYKFLSYNIATNTYNEKVFSLGQISGSTLSGIQTYYYYAAFTLPSITYDNATKKLNIKAKVYFQYKDKDMTDTATVSAIFNLVFVEK